MGASTRLGCPIQESPDSEAQGTVSPGELPGCVAALVDTWAEPGLEALLRELRRGTAHDMP